MIARFSLNDRNCRDEVIALLREIRLKARFLDGDREAGFNTEQNALITVNAEKYYSSMIGFGNESWNIRDRHMMETLERLLLFHGPLKPILSACRKMQEYPPKMSFLRTIQEAVCS